jgi:anthranilate phosphoribosyltransferase
MVVAGEVGDGRILDELSTLGENLVAEFYQDRGFHSSRWHPRDFPLQPVGLQDLVGGDASENARLVEGVIDGTDRGPRRDAVLLNAGAALMLAGVARSISDGWEIAGHSIDSGRAFAQIRCLRKFR